EQRVSVMEADLFPPGRADLIVCNPPWLPGAPTSALELGIYDEGSGMLRGFLAGLGDHLAPDGEAWLVLSDLAEHLGLRPRGKLLQLIDRAGLEVVGKLATPARHPRAKDDRDPLHAARSQEVTTLWRLRPAACGRRPAAWGRRPGACARRRVACGPLPHTSCAVSGIRPPASTMSTWRSESRWVSATSRPPIVAGTDVPPRSAWCTPSSTTSSPTPICSRSAGSSNSSGTIPKLARFCQWIRAKDTAITAFSPR